MIDWKKARTGLYTAEYGPCTLIVVQDGELWRSIVAFEGLEVDRAEWDGRLVALRNAVGAAKRAISNRSPLHVLRKREQESLLEGDDDE